MTTPTIVRVLLVDDEENIRFSVARLLSRRLRPGQQIEIETAGDVHSALLKLEDGSYDLVLTDYRMPLATGAELLARVEQRWPLTRRVLMTGYGDIDERVRSSATTAIEHVVNKPWDTTAFLAALRHLLWPLEAAAS
jgi:DNA-binding NtrC family response regulator